MEHGDYTRIMELFNSKHKRSDRKKISLPYVYLILKGERRVTEGGIAEEIIQITEHYLNIKDRTKEELMIMNIVR
jgi:hypothetical protein